MLCNGSMTPSKKNIQTPVETGQLVHLTGSASQHPARLPQSVPHSLNVPLVCYLPITDTSESHNEITHALEQFRNEEQNTATVPAM